MAQQTPSGIVRQASTLSILWGVSLIILIWRVLVGLAYLFFGVYACQN